jgi:hypothetical protein
MQRGCEFAAPRQIEKRRQLKGLSGEPAMLLVSSASKESCSTLEQI